MTKSKSTKLMSLLLALVLVTSCFVGGTLARYVTSTSSEDSARVAVWGINADDVEMDLFDGSYTVNGVLVADSEDGDNIIAPGTEKDNYFSIVNLDDNLKPEVMYEVAINLDDSEIDPLILNNPSIVWRLDNGEYGTWEETKAKILALSGDVSGVKTYAPLAIANEFTADKTHTIGWKWIMDNNNNVMDTEMGNKAATDGDISAKIVVKVTATQVNVDTTGMLNGNGQVYDINNPTPLVFRSAAPAEELVEVKIGDETLTRNSDYTVDSGSTIITLTESCINRLGVGNFTISIVSENMTAKASFSITETENIDLATVKSFTLYYWDQVSTGVTTFNYEEGMTWLDWVNSDYAPNGWYADTDFNALNAPGAQFVYTIAIDDNENRTYGETQHANTLITEEEYVTSIYFEATENTPEVSTFNIIETVIYGESVRTTTYEYEVGMTWGEWIDSEYNTNGYLYYDSGIISTAEFADVGISRSYADYEDYQQNFVSIHKSELIDSSLLYEDSRVFSSSNN